MYEYSYFHYIISHAHIEKENKSHLFILLAKSPARGILEEDDI